MAAIFYSDPLVQALRFLGESVPKAAPAKAPAAVKRAAVPARKAGATIAEPLAPAYEARQVRSVEAHRPLEAPELRPRVIDSLARRLGVDEALVLSVAGIAQRTFHRRQKEGETLTAAESDRVLRIARVSSVAERVFGDPAKSNRWMTKESAVLGALPLALLASDAGAREVEDELERISWGDFA